jgi:hypothetical protein
LSEVRRWFFGPRSRNKEIREAEWKRKCDIEGFDENGILQAYLLADMQVVLGSDI